MRARLHEGEEGANAVEFALILPVLLILVFGIIYFGFAFNTQLTLTQAAREGARLGATFPIDPATGAPGEDWYEAVLARIDDAAFGDSGIGNGPRNICVGFNDQSGNVTWETRGAIAVSDCQVDVSPDVAGEPHVQIYFARQVPVELIVIPSRSLTVSATSVARYEGVTEEETS